MTIFPRSIEEWYKPLTREEKIWIALAFIVALTLAGTTIAWHFIDRSHQVPSIAVEADPREFLSKAMEFSRTYSGKVVPEGTDIYLAAVRFTWIPSELILKAGVTYRIWVSSPDVLHGLSIIGPGDVVYNVMVMPGMAYVIHVKFDKPGEYEIRCNEFCGIGHANMIGRIRVVG
ncbi:cytochrome C oxidase subunit II [Desulfurococcaceae archaeon AG1]|jgi:cytochrome c oxidase subunit 2|nr:MAG: hypothetical protein DJ555_04175 [Desulfurococcaceae archaeon]GAY25618.1 cytochrome C oxidase subunit II [Desulfurococcaceae archaeon AG1]